MRAVYLHGFASGPGSRKARFFRERLEGAGLEVEIPDLAEGDFENLTISRQLAVALRAAGQGPVHAIGSSMGGYLASLLAARHPGLVDRLVLLAPAFGFAERWPSLVGEAAMERWLETGKLPVYHYAEGRTRDLGLAIHRDSQLWEPEPRFPQPAMIFHGVNDRVVPVQASRDFARGHANVTLFEMNSDHELLDALPAIWEQAGEFLAGSGSL